MRRAARSEGAQPEQGLCVRRRQREPARRAGRRSGYLTRRAGSGRRRRARRCSTIPRRGTVEERARAYLDVNCGHCHNPSGLARTSGLYLNIEEMNPARYGVCKPPVAAGQGSGDRRGRHLPRRARRVDPRLPHGIDRARRRHARARPPDRPRRGRRASSASGSPRSKGSAGRVRNVRWTCVFRCVGRPQAIGRRWLLPFVLLVDGGCRGKRRRDADAVSRGVGRRRPPLPAPLRSARRALPQSRWLRLRGSAASQRRPARRALAEAAEQGAQACTDAQAEALGYIDAADVAVRISECAHGTSARNCSTWRSLRIPPTFRRGSSIASASWR